MKLKIADKLFLGFLVVIFLNLFFVLVTSRLTALNSVASVLRNQNFIRNSLLQISSNHASQARSRIIFEKIGKKESATNFVETGKQNQIILDSITSTMREILISDSEIDVSSELQKRDSILHYVLNDDLSKSSLKYSSVVPSIIQIKNDSMLSDEQKRIALLSLDNEAMLADKTIKVALATADSLLDVNSLSRISNIEDRVNSVKRLTMIILGWMAVFSIFFAMFFSRHITNPLKRLQNWAANIGKGDFDLAKKRFPSDEIGELSDAFYDMANELKKTQEELATKNRLAAIGEIVASINHEINNPLMIISGNAQFLEMTIENGVTEDTKERIKAIIDESDRISKVTQKLRDIKVPVTEKYTSEGERMIDLKRATRENEEG